MSKLNAFAVLPGLLMAVCLLAAGCAPEARKPLLETVAEKKELVVGVKSDAPPFSFKTQGQYAGYDVDLAEQIAHKLGVTVRFVEVTTANRIQKVKDNEVDLIAASMTITREREKEVDFSLAYFATKQAFLVKQDSPVQGYMDLAKKKVGTLRGSTSTGNLAVVQPDSVAVLFETNHDAFEALKAGKVDAVTSDLVLLIGLAQIEPEQYKVVGGFGYEPYGLAMRENESQFRGKVDEILQELWDEGKIAQMIENWFGVKSRFPANIEFTMETFPTGK